MGYARKATSIEGDKTGVSSQPWKSLENQFNKAHQINWLFEKPY